MYTPDKWVVLEVETPEFKTRKILASWYGGYLDGDSWRLSSGITNIEDNDDHYLIHNESGSTYQCFKESQGMSIYTTSIYQEWLDTKPEHVSMTIAEKL